MNLLGRLTGRVRMPVNGRMAIANPTSAKLRRGMDELESVLSPEQRARVEHTRRRSAEREARGLKVRRSYG